MKTHDKKNVTGYIDLCVQDCMKTHDKKNVTGYIDQGSSFKTAKNSLVTFFKI